MVTLGAEAIYGVLEAGHRVISFVRGNLYPNPQAKHEESDDRAYGLALGCTRDSNFLW